MFVHAQVTAEPWGMQHKGLYCVTGPGEDWALADGALAQAAWKWVFRQDNIKRRCARTPGLCRLAQYNHWSPQTQSSTIYAWSALI